MTAFRHGFGAILALSLVGGATFQLTRTQVRVLSAEESRLLRGGQTDCWMNSTGTCAKSQCAGCDSMNKCMNTVATAYTPQTNGSTYPKVAAFDPSVAITGTTDQSVSTALCGTESSCQVGADCEFNGMTLQWQCKQGASTAWYPSDASETKLGFLCPRGT